MNHMRSSMGMTNSIKHNQSIANQSIPQNISQQNMDLDIIDEKNPTYPKTPQTQSNNFLSKKIMMDTEENMKPNDEDEFDVPDEESNITSGGDIRSL